MASRIVSAFTTFRNYDPARQVGAAALVLPGAARRGGRRAGATARRRHLALAAQLTCCLTCPPSLPSGPLYCTHLPPTLLHPRAAVQALMRAQLERIKGTEGLSENVFEIVAKTLKD